MLQDNLISNGKQTDTGLNGSNLSYLIAIGYPVLIF